jgi:hypothetical protein
MEHDQHQREVGQNPPPALFEQGDSLGGHNISNQADGD